MSKIILPNYNNSILNVISSIRKYYGYTSVDKTNEYVDKALKTKPKHIILMLLDGLGSKVIEENCNSNSFFSTNKVSDLISIYPSTTSAATVSTISGQTPYETGWTGWENYFPELNKNVVLFQGKDYFTEENLGINIRKNYLPYDEFYKNFPGINAAVFPPYGENPSATFPEFLKNVKKINNQDCQTFIYAYWDEPDATMHMTGMNSKQTKEIIQSMENMIEEKIEAFDSKTLLIVVADHGHINVEPIYLKQYKDIMGLLKRPPSNDARCITFSVIDDKKDEFVCLFNKYFKEYYKLYTKEEFINNGFLGPTNRLKNKYIDVFMADYVAVATSDMYFNYKNEADDKDKIVMKSHHAGMTEQEMLIPLIIYSKA